MFRLLFVLIVLSHKNLQMQEYIEMAWFSWALFKIYLNDSKSEWNMLFAKAVECFPKG